VDAVLTKSAVHRSNDAADLKGVKFAYAPRQHLADVDGQADSLFHEVLRDLKHAGAELVEIDLGGDFHALSARTTWPIFFHETLPAVRDFLAANEVPVPFEQIYAGLGEHIKQSWSRSVLPSSAGYVSDETYWTAMNTSPTRAASEACVDCFSTGGCAAFPDHPMRSALDREPVEVPGRQQRGHGHFLVTKHASLELRGPAGN
jgi:mandelamide amidase